jgi:glycerol-3-phosphate dehydrogenase
VEKLYEGEQAYMLQHSDKRIVFVIPYHSRTLIGTTDVPFSGSPDEIYIDDNEIDYLCTLVNQYFNKQLRKSDIITTWSGIRPLLSDAHKSASKLSRDYAYHYASAPAPAVTVYGGKITTYRQLASQAVNELRKIFPNLLDSSTENTPLPGAATSSMSFSEYQNYARQKYEWLETDVKERYLKTYGTHMEIILAGCNNMNNLGSCFTPTLYRAEVDYLIKNEWATNSEDILWRRTKLGLVINEQEKKNLDDYLLKML